MAKANEEIQEIKEKTVKIKLPISRAEHDDEWVAVNGRSWLIKRGVEVEVPAYVYEVLQHRDEMLAEALEFEMAAANKLEDLEK